MGGFSGAVSVDGQVGGWVVRCAVAVCEELIMMVRWVFCACIYTARRRAPSRATFAHAPCVYVLRFSVLCVSREESTSFSDSFEVLRAFFFLVNRGPQLMDNSNFAGVEIMLTCTVLAHVQRCCSGRRTVSACTLN